MAKKLKFLESLVGGFHIHTRLDSSEYIEKNPMRASEKRKKQ
jgi:hypothetical protein